MLSRDDFRPKNQGVKIVSRGRKKKYVLIWVFISIKEVELV